MNLYIAEKPSVAKDIAKALGSQFQKKDGYLESADNVVTWCYGHLLKSIEPEAYNPAYAQWKAEDLPLQLYPLRYEPITGKEVHTQTVINLIKKADVIVHAATQTTRGNCWLMSCLNILATASRLSAC